MPRPKLWIYRYSYRIKWSPEDEQYVATCDEFPSLSWLADTPAVAMYWLEQVITDTIADMIAAGEMLPLPADAS